MPTINDANGTPMRINDKGFGLIVGAAMPFPSHAADSGDAYSVVLEVDTTAATCDFFYMKNSAESLLRIYQISANAITANCQIQIKTGATGTPAGSANLTPVNSLVGSGSIVTAGDVQYRNGGDMGLTGGNIYDTLWVATADPKDAIYNYPAEIALAKNQTLIFHAVADTGGNLNMTVFFYYHEPVV
jgi:hypothetical protein